VTAAATSGCAAASVALDCGLLPALLLPGAGLLATGDRGWLSEVLAGIGLETLFVVALLRLPGVGDEVDAELGLFVAGQVYDLCSWQLKLALCATGATCGTGKQCDPIEL
jgi:hypothetical protein